MDNPELVAENKTFAFVSAAFFWAKKKNIYDRADKSKPELDNEEIVNRVTDLVNGGANKESRTKRINSYKRIREANIFKKFK